MELTELKDKIAAAFAGTKEELAEVLALIDEDKSIKNLIFGKFSLL